MKRLVFGIVWCIGFYFLGCGLTGGVAGAIAGSRDPQNASVAGARAGEKAVRDVWGFILGGALILSVLGTVTGLLPGTRADSKS
jgi:amino acid transporter